MTLFTLVFISIIILATVTSIGIPIIKNLTQEAQGTTESSYQTYVNETNNFQIQYPSNWFAETKSAFPESFEVVRIYPKELMAERYPTVSFIVGFIPDENATANMGGKPNLTGLSKIILAGVEAESDYRLINSSTKEKNVTVSFANGTEPKAIPALVMNDYDFTRLLLDTQEVNIAFIVDDNIVYFTYDAAKDGFTKYFPQVQKMINSFQIGVK